MRGVWVFPRLVALAATLALGGAPMPARGFSPDGPRHSPPAARGAAPADAQRPQPPCPGPGLLAGRALVEEDASLRLADGSVVTPAGTAWLQARDAPAPDGPDPQHLRALLADREIALPTAAEPDRWGRRPAHLWVPDADGEPVLLAALLLEAGLARVAPEGLPAGCAAFLLAIEARARAAAAGLWPRATVGPWQSTDEAALAGLVGRYGLIEGLIVSRGQGRDRIYLNFGRFRDNGFVVTIRKGSLNRVPDWGKRLDALEGRRVRVRGVVLKGRQLAIEVAVPWQIERLD
jgi:micrococcal nuclease